VVEPKKSENNDAQPGLIDRFLDRLIEFFVKLGGAKRISDKERDTTITRLDRVLDGMLNTISACLLIAITIAVLCSVFMRYVLNWPPLWSEEAPIVLFIWMTFAALAVATRRDVNIRVTFFIEKFNPRSRLVLEVIMHILILVMIAFIIWYSIPIISLQLRGQMLSTGWSNAVSWFPLPIGMVLIGFYQTVLMRRSILNYQCAMKELKDRTG
jgi:TRAP-type C4-dicarboxylate transport system permease small subunit